MWHANISIRYIKTQYIERKLNDDKGLICKIIRYIDFFNYNNNYYIVTWRVSLQVRD